MDVVADELGRALTAAATIASATGPGALLQSVIPTDATTSVTVPRDAIERARLVADRPELWESSASHRPLLNLLTHARSVVYRRPVRTLTIPWLLLVIVGAITDSDSAVLVAPWSVLFCANIVVVGVKLVRRLFAPTRRQP